jgi:hypothetical protein
MPVGAVLVQELNVSFPAGAGSGSNSATVTLNFASTFVVATASVNLSQHNVSTLGVSFSVFANIVSFETSQGDEFSAGSVLTNNDVTSITFGLEVNAFGVLTSELGEHFAGGTFMVLGFD